MHMLYDSFCGAMDRCGCFLEDADESVRGYAAGFLAGGVVSVARRYAEEGCSSSESQLEELLDALLSGSLFR